jgi:hypothetical protein
MGLPTNFRGTVIYLVKNPEGFVLDEAYGPLPEGEIERAKEWSGRLVESAQPRSQYPNESTESKT